VQHSRSVKLLFAREFAEFSRLSLDQCYLSLYHSTEGDW